jgi:hypothetical protein
MQELLKILEAEKEQVLSDAKQCRFGSCEKYELQGKAAGIEFCIKKIRGKIVLKKIKEK